MEANNVEEYLQSARQTRIVQRSSSTRSATDPVDESSAHVGEESVFNGEAEVGSEVVEDVSAQKGGQQRRVAYQPCTIPQRRDNISLPAQGEGQASPASSSSSSEVSHKGLRHDHALDGVLAVQVLQDPKLRKKSTLHYQYEKPHNFKVQRTSCLSATFCIDYTRHS